MVIAVVAIWVYGLSIVAPAALAMLALHLLWLRDKWSAQSAPDMRVTKDA
jgi:hypothetical protein